MHILPVSAAWSRSYFLLDGTVCRTTPLFSLWSQFSCGNLTKRHSIDSVFQNLVKFLYPVVNAHKPIGEKREESMTFAVELFHRHYANEWHNDRHLSSLRRPNNQNSQSPDSWTSEMLFETRAVSLFAFLQAPTLLATHGFIARMLCSSPQI